MSTSPWVADPGFGPHGMRAATEGLASYGKRMEAARDMGAVVKWGVFSNLRQLQHLSEDPALREKYRELQIIRRANRNLTKPLEAPEWVQDEIDELLWVSDGWRVL